MGVVAADDVRTEVDGWQFPLRRDSHGREASFAFGSKVYAFSVSPDAESFFLAALTRQNARNIPAAERTQNTGSAIFAAEIVSRNARPHVLQDNSNTKKPMHGSATARRRSCLAPHA
jgi:hypothetical protein